MRWGYTARSWHAAQTQGVCPPLDAEPDGPVRHAWNGLPAKRPGAPLYAICGAALRGLGPRSDYFDPAHPRACKRCIDQADDA